MKTENSRRAIVYHGIEILKRSTLLVLYEHHQSGPRQYLAQSRVAEHLGITRLFTPWVGGGYALASCILELLAIDGYAEAIGNGRWQITEKGISVIES